MPARIHAIITTVQRGREAVDALFGRLLDLAQLGPIPCAFLVGYNAVRTRQMRVEQALVQAAKQAQLHPPEDAPRAFAIFGACPAGTMFLTVDPRAIKAGREYLKQVTLRRAKTDEALLKAYQTNPEFRKKADTFLEALAPQARVNTDETLPPPRNIGLLKLLYFIGGAPWNVDDADMLRQFNIREIEEAEVAKIVKDAGDIFAAVSDVAEEKQGEAKKKPGAPWWVWGLGAVALGGLGFGVYKFVAGRRSGYRGLRSAFGEGEEGAGRRRRRRALPSHVEAE